MDPDVETTGDPAARPAGVAPVVVGLGEALFDCFEDGAKLGGAPVNVCVHAAALLSARHGVAAPATRVGDDELGRRFFAELSDRGLSLDAVQVDADRPTGRVFVEVGADGDAHYRFESDVAWDALQTTPAWAELARRCDAVVFGTLAQRSPTSRRAIVEFVGSASQALRLFDANLRGDYYSPEVLAESLRVASAAKLNEDELVEVGDLLGAGLGAEATTEQRAQQLRDRHGLDWVAVTRGAQGAVLFDAEGMHESSVEVGLPADAADDRDTVGAGDACCAGLIVGALLEFPPERKLHLANRAGAYVASRRGATPRLPQSVLDLVA